MAWLRGGLPPPRPFRLLGRCSSCFPAELYPPPRELQCSSRREPDISLANKTGHLDVLPTRETMAGRIGLPGDQYRLTPLTHTSPAKCRPLRKLVDSASAARTSTSR